MKKSVLLTLFTALLFSSCNLTLDGTPRGSGAGNGSIPSEETNVKINFGREALLYEGEADPRYVILPNFSSLTSLSDYRIEKIRVYVDSTTQDFNIAHGQTSIELRITQESHTIKLEGLDGSDKVVLKSDDWTGNITSGIVVPLGLKPFSQDASATDKGSVKLTINFPAKTSTITEYYVKCDVDGTGAEGAAGASGEHVELLSSVQGKTFTITDLDPGTHHVNITISKNSSFNGNATISFNAIVYAGLESSTVYDHSSQLTSAITYTHNDFKSVTIHDYALCVNGNGGKFPSNGISELPSGKLIGGKDRCIVFESIKEALDFTQDVDVGLSLDNEYTVYISGEIKASDTSDLQDGTNLVEIGLTGKTVNLTGYKETASDTPTLNANSKGRVLKVSAGTVKIEGVTLENGSLIGNYYGGGIYIENGASVTLNDGSIITQSHARYGGGIYNAGELTINTGAQIIKNSAYHGQLSESAFGGGIYSVNKVTMNDGYITQNEGGKWYGSTVVGRGGGVFLTGSAVFDMYGGEISSNQAHVDGGGVFIDSGSFKLTGGIIKGNFLDSSVTGHGSGIYNDASFVMDGSGYLDQNNDIYLTVGKTIDVSDTLDPPAAAGGIAGLITPEVWERGRQLLGGNVGDNVSKFVLADNEWTIADHTTSGELCTDYKIYVSGVDHKTGTGGVGDGDNLTGNGTKSKPYASIEKAVEQCWHASEEFTIYVSGKLTTAQYIPEKNEEDEMGLASSIIIEGLEGNTKDMINRGLSAVPSTGSGSCLIIETEVPVTIKKLKLTGGYTQNGGGIYCSTQKANITLGENAIVTSNNAENCGGGIYMSNSSSYESYLTILDGAVISNNKTTATSGDDTGGAGIFCTSKCSIVMKGGSIFSNKSQTYGGGIFNKGTVYMSGGATIGNSSVASTNYSTSETDSSNYAKKQGGGIYNNGDTSNRAVVYLGKTWDFDESQVKDETLSKGIYYNYALNTSNSGGAVWCGQYADLTIVSGNIANNGGRQSAGISNNGGNLRVVSSSDSTISFTKNYANSSSGAIQSSVDFEMGGNVFFNNWSGIHDNNVLISNQKIKLVSPLNENTTIGITAYPTHVSNGSVVIEKTSSYSGDFASDAKKCSYIPNGTVPKYLKIAEDGCFRMEPSSSLSDNDFTDFTPLDDWSHTWNEEPGITTVDDFSDKPVLRMFLKIPDTESYVALKISFTGHGGDFIYDAWTVLTDGSKVHKAPDDTIEFDYENWFIYIDFDGNDSNDISIKFQGGEVNLEAEKDDTKYYIFD